VQEHFLHFPTQAFGKAKFMPSIIGEQKENVTLGEASPDYLELNLQREAKRAADGGPAA
jgi:hypothetical protein